MHLRRFSNGFVNSRSHDAVFTLSMATPRAAIFLRERRTTLTAPPSYPLSGSFVDSLLERPVTQLVLPAITVSDRYYFVCFGWFSRGRVGHGCFVSASRRIEASPNVADVLQHPVAVMRAGSTILNFSIRKIWEELRWTLYLQMPCYFQDSVQLTHCVFNQITSCSSQNDLVACSM